MFCRIGPELQFTAPFIPPAAKSYFNVARIRLDLNKEFGLEKPIVRGKSNPFCPNPKDKYLIERKAGKAAFIG